MINIDFDEILDTLRFYRRIVFFVFGLVALGLLLWLFCPRGGNPEVKATLDEIKTTTETNERRVDDILDSTKAKEVAASEEIKTAVDSASADALPDLLAGLLADYRKNNR